MVASLLVAGRLGPLQTAPLPDLVGDARFWVLLASLIALVAVAIGVWALVVQVRRVRDETAKLSVLDEIQHQVGRLVRDRDDLDLRRLEHLLIDIRDGNRRLEDALLRISQPPANGVGTASTSLTSGPSESSVGERIVNRFLALGYDRVHVVTPSDELVDLVRSDGDVLVEARRQGVLYKGRAVLRGGAISDVEMNPAYSIFP